MTKQVERLKEQLQNKTIASRLVIFLGALGMALILLSELFFGGQSDSKQTQTATQSIVSEEATLTTMTISTEERYRAKLEANLAELIEQMEGAGETAVMITLVSGEESIYAQDITQSDNQLSQSYVLLDDGNALTQMVLTPEVCGVAVLCQGGDDIVIVAKITTLVTALFDVSSNRVSVEKLA